MRASSFPSLRRPVRAARTLCPCQPVAAVRSPIAAPSGRCSRVRIMAFFDGRAVAAAEPVSTTSAAAVAMACRACPRDVDFSGVFRTLPLLARLSADFFGLVMMDLLHVRALYCAVTATSPAGQGQLG